VLSRLLEEAADNVRVRRAEVRHGAKSWGWERRASARIEASTMGFDIRCVVTNLETGSAEWLYDTLYCARTGKEPDQSPQGPDRLRPHQLPISARQPGPPRAANHRLLAHAQ